MEDNRSSESPATAESVQAIRRVDVLFPALFLLVIGFFFVYALMQSRPAADFPSFYYGAKALQNGLNPYDYETITTIAKDDGLPATVSPYLYPPILAIVLGSITSLPYNEVQLIWRCCNFLLLLSSLILVLKFSRWSITQSASRFSFGETSLDVALFATTLAAFVILYPVQADLKIGQINIVIMFLICLFIFPTKQKSLYQHPVLLSIGAFFKITPMMYTLVYIIKKEYRKAIVFSLISIFILLITILFGFSDVWKNFFSFVQRESYGKEIYNLSPSHYLNGSFAGFLTRLLGDNHPMIPALCYALTGSLLVIVLFMKRHFRSDEGLSFLLLLLTIVLLAASPFMWVHHCVLLFPGLAGVFSILFSRPCSWSMRIPIVFCSFCATMPFYKLAFAFEHIPSLAIALSVCNFVALMFLFFMLLTVAVRLNLSGNSPRS